MRSSRRTLGGIVFGLLLVLLSAGLFAALLGALADEREYTSAPACPDGTRSGATRSGACTTDVRATVTSTYDEAHGKSSWYWITVTEQGSDTERRVRMAGKRPVFNTVPTGGAVTLTYWKGEVRTVRFDTATQETYESPAEGWRLPTAFGLLTLPFGLGMLLCGLRFRYAATTPPAHSWAVMGIVAGGCLSAIGFPVAMLSPGLPETLLITAAGIPPIALLVALCAWRMRRRTTTEPTLTAART
ncbi:hypothetical protein [Streptomyces sp. NPDC050704]|uniref:hypothetical protein n=1 Tax=Streptomyces sp. NPDC050704 TaxID=3157219 RepID=UPI0034364266